MAHVDRAADARRDIPMAGGQHVAIAAGYLQACSALPSRMEEERISVTSLTQVPSSVIPPCWGTTVVTCAQSVLRFGG